MGFYEEMQAIATDLLTEFNQGQIEPIYVVKTDSDTPWKPETTDYYFDPLNGVVKGVSSKYIMRGLALEGDLEITTQVGGLPPEPNMYLGLSSGRYKVVSFEAIPANGTAVVWKFIARKA